uniref:Uncharacterized protein n=1 Tax=Anguilla anguilla TaxID=7936 RepID=A0A0E9PK85_ANGAN
MMKCVTMPGAYGTQCEPLLKTGQPVIPHLVHIPLLV